jgi:hypothetical protein
LEDLEGESLLGTGLLIVFIWRIHQMCIWNLVWYESAVHCGLIKLQGFTKYCF